jgi:hypothetical protein
MRFYHSSTYEHTYIVNTMSMYVSLSTNGAPPCRTMHARDAAGAARNLGAIHGGSRVPPAVPLPTAASSARNVHVGRFIMACTLKS